MQLGHHTDLIERLMFYLSCVYVSKISKGKSGFKDLKKVHCICITRDTLFPNVTEYHHKINFRSETGMLLSDKMEFIFVELEKFTKLASELDNELEELLFMMKNAHTIDLENKANIPLFLGKSWYTKTMKELNLSKMSSENRLIYELAWARIAATAMQDEIDTKRWKEEAKEEAREEMREEIKQEVIQEAREELTNVITEEVTNKMVENLLKIGKLSIEDIAAVTQESVDFVLSIKTKMR
jgi:predicted transposase/invertase (TIGR01784 family)